MKLLNVLRETPIGCALIAYFVDLPRWTLLNIIFTLALAPSLLAGLRGQMVLAALLSFPAALVMTAIVRLLTVTVDGRIPNWWLLWADLRPYNVVLSAWLCCMLAVIALLTPLLYVVVIPALILLLVVPLAVCCAARLNVSPVEAWRNAFIMVVHYPVVALGLILLGIAAIWGIGVSGGALIIALPALWVAIAVYTVDDLIRSLAK